MVKSALKVVERPSFHIREGEFWSTAREAQLSHSLHGLLPWQGGSTVSLVQFFVEQFSKRGEIVLDPFCGNGGVGLECALRGRICYQSDFNTLPLRVAAAKLRPADISEVTLWLQQRSLRRPVSVEQYRSGFNEFYDLDTFREIVALREYVAEDSSRVGRFIEAVAMSLLHGHSAGYFSVYTFPQIALSVDEQRKLNVKHRVGPEYRSVMPRILKRAAQVLRDGVPSCLADGLAIHRVELCDARSLDYVPSHAVSLVVSAPPLPGNPFASRHQWLREWFVGLRAARQCGQTCLSTVEEWLSFMNESLMEFARVIRSGGRVVFNLRRAQCSTPGGMVDLAPLLVHMIEQELARYWDAECLYVQHARAPRIQNRLRSRPQEGSEEESRALVLRRR